MEVLTARSLTLNVCFEASAARLRASVAWLDTIQTESHCSPPILYSRIAPFVMAGGAEILFYEKKDKAVDE